MFVVLLGAGCAAAFSNLGQAQDANSPSPVPENVVLPPPELHDSIALSIPAPGQFKKGLLDLGLNFQLNYTGEVLGNPSGGIKQRAIYDNLLELAIDGDLKSPD